MATDILEELVEKLSNLKALELSQLKTKLEETWGVTAAAPVAFAAAPAAVEAVEESVEFEVTLTEVPADKKIAVIKIVRELTGANLKDAKDLVESAPKVLKEKASKSESEEISKKLSDAGAKVTVKGL